MEHDHMIEAFATNGANHPLDIGSLPRRARCRQDFASQRFEECREKNEHGLEL
jgi:hypothetical protein